MEMRERIARAMYDGLRGRVQSDDWARLCGGGMREWPDLPQDVRDHWQRFAADAVLVALREPTEAMVEAGLDAMWPGDEIIFDDQHDDAEPGMIAAWQAMLTAALK